MDFSAAVYLICMLLWAEFVVGHAVNMIGRKCVGCVVKCLEEGCVLLFELGQWEMLIAALMLLCVLCLILVATARTENASSKGKAKVVERVAEKFVKKRKGSQSQSVKAGKGSSKAKSKGKAPIVDEEGRTYEELVDLGLRKPLPKSWEESIASRGFKYERAIALETFDEDHLTKRAITIQGLFFLGDKVAGYLPSFVRDFYTNMDEDENHPHVLRSVVNDKPFVVTPQSIALCLDYTRPPASSNPFPRRQLVDKSDIELAHEVCKDPRKFKKNFSQGLLKSEYALMNKLIHYSLWPQGSEKKPKLDDIKFLYEVMQGKVIDHALVIWEAMRDFPKTSWKSHMPFPALITQLAFKQGIKKPNRVELETSKFGRITSGTQRKSDAMKLKEGSPQSPSAAASTSPLKRLERKIRGWFRLILGKQRRLEHRLESVMREQRTSRGLDEVIPEYPPNLEEGLSEELDAVGGEDDGYDEGGGSDDEESSEDDG